MDVLNPRSDLRGIAQLGRVTPGGMSVMPRTGLILPGTWEWGRLRQSNLVLYSWAKIVAELLRGNEYPLNYVYIEFENNGGAAVTAPAYDRSGGREYYDGLDVDATRDYLRVPLTATALTSSDEELFPDGNLLTVYAQTAGTAGVHGKAFSDGVSSRVFGGAVVSAPVASDPTQDVIFSRFYFVSASQLIKQAGSQITMNWALTLN